MLGLTRRNRLRDHMRENVTLYGALKHYDELSGAASEIAKLIDLQAKGMLEVHTASGRQWNWGSSALSLVLAGLSGFLCYVLWPLSDWWRVVLFVPLALIGALFATACLGVLVSRKEVDQ